MDLAITYSNQQSDPEVAFHERVDLRRHLLDCPLAHGDNVERVDGLWTALPPTTLSDSVRPPHRDQFQ